jgi:hypothetical protein
MFSLDSVFIVLPSYQLVRWREGRKWIVNMILTGEAVSSGFSASIRTSIV